MIKWPNLVFPAINLWNCPRQEELIEILRLKHFKAGADFNVARAQATENAHKRRSQYYDKLIKEREFLYYLHSGRFPE